MTRSLLKLFDAKRHLTPMLWWGAAALGILTCSDPLIHNTSAQQQATSKTDNSALALLPKSEGVSASNSQDTTPSAERESVNTFRLNLTSQFQPLNQQPSAKANDAASGQSLSPSKNASERNETSGWQPPATQSIQQVSLNQDRDRGQPASVRNANLEEFPSVYQLQHVSMIEFEEKLQSVWRGNFESAMSPDNRYRRFALANPKNSEANPIVILVDRQTGQLTFEGQPSDREIWLRTMQLIDISPSNQNNSGSVTQAVLHPAVANVDQIRQAAFRLGNRQDGDQLPGESLAQNPTMQDQEMQDLLGRVQLSRDPQTGLIVVVGDNPEDVAKVQQVIRDLDERLAQEARKTINLQLKHVSATNIAQNIQELYDAAYLGSFGTAEIRANSINNTLIVVGQPGALERIREIVSEFDVPGEPMEVDNFRTFRLKYISAVDAKSRLDLYFGQSVQQLGAGEQLPSTPVVTITDFRSNVLTIKGSAQTISEAEKFLADIDVDSSDSVHEIKVVKVFNRSAEELAVIVQDAINGNLPNAGSGFKGVDNLLFAQQQVGQVQNNPNQSFPAARSLMMRGEGVGEDIASGILFDARLTADRDANTIVVSAPAKSIQLIERLIRELDRIPDVDVQLKIFQIVHGDAVELLATLQSLFDAGTAQAAGVGAQGGLNLPLQSVGTTPGSALVNIRFSSDPRTNSILATGPVGDLEVVEALLSRLDEERADERVTHVHRLSNTPPLDMADTINELLNGRDTINDIDPRFAGNINQTNRRVIVVPEVTSQSLVIQARPEYLDEIVQIIKDLDRRPPMVHVKAMIAEVDLNRLEEFGVEWGLQDSILFGRNTSIGGGGEILGGIGFPFNNPGAVGNLNALAPGTVAAQGLSSLGVGRTNPTAGFGGFVFSAGSESVNLLIRSLQSKQCIRVLSRPELMTMENLQGRVQSGAEIGRIAGTTLGQVGVTQDIQFLDVGVILEVTPRVSPDGLIILSVLINKSDLGPDGSGTVVGVGNDGTPILSPLILKTEARSTLMARSGQTLVFSGLIQETKGHTQRGIPILSDIPGLGPLFRFESDSAQRTELLIVLTPSLVTDDDDVDFHNYELMDRMHWCLEDVAEVYGNTEYHRYDGTESATQTIYPVANPTGAIGSGQ